MRRGFAAVALPGVMALALFAAWCAVAAARALANDGDPPKLEGALTPQARLDQVRQDRSLADDPAAVDALARDAEAFPPGRVRVEARMFVAEAWRGRLHRPADALAPLRAVRDDPDAPAVTVRLAAREIVDTLVSEGRLDEASAEAASQAGLLDPAFLKQIRAIVRRRTIRWVALAELAGFAAMVGVALLRGFRRGALGHAGTALRRIAPVTALFLVYLAGLGGPARVAVRDRERGPLRRARARRAVPHLAGARLGRRGIVGHRGAGGARSRVRRQRARRDVHPARRRQPVVPGGIRPVSDAQETRDTAAALEEHLLAVRVGHGANCSSIGSVIDTLFATAVVGAAVFAAVAAALKSERVRVVGPRKDKP